MRECPAIVGGARVLCFTPLDARHRHTGNTLQLVAGQPAPPAAGLAIARYDGEDACYLFSCDERWGPLTDTWHQTLDEAKAQAEFEYEGTVATWVAR